MTRRWNFFNKDGRREPFLVNPSPLIVANPRKKKRLKQRKKGVIEMATAKRRANGRFMKSNSPARKRRRHPRANPPNPPKRRRRRNAPFALFKKNAAHRRRRRNPEGVQVIQGVSLPDGSTMIETFAGVCGPDVIDALLQQWVNQQPAPPAWYTTANATMIRAVEYAALPLVALMFDKKAASNVLFGELMLMAYYQVMNLIAPAAAATPTSGYIPAQAAPNNSAAARLAGLGRMQRGGRGMRGPTKMIPGAAAPQRRLAGYIPPGGNMRGYPTTPDRLAKRYGSW